MNWDLATIRTKLRKLTGRLDSNVVVNADLDDEINAYYQHQFPDEVEVHEFDGFTEFSTVAGTQDYSVPNTVLAVQRPVQLTDAANVVTPVDLYTDVELFKKDYPDDAHDEADERDQPTAMLLFGRTMTLRPTPDAVYTVKYVSKGTQPTALSGESDTPTDEKWGPIIAYGAAIEYLNTHGQNDEADEKKDLYTFYRRSIARKQLRQIPIGQRAQPRY